jgi:hypothetical protein
VGLIGWLLLRYQITLDPEVEAALLTIVEGIVVYTVPNTPARVRR